MGYTLMFPYHLPHL